MNEPLPGRGSALVVDDHPLFRGALATVARDLLGEANVHEANTAEAALSLAASIEGLRLVLLDFRLPGLNGAEAVQAFAHRFPSAAVIVVSASEERREADAAMRAGARAFVQKTAALETIADAIRAVLLGGTIEPRWDLRRPGSAAAVASEQLTPRQSEILALLCQGLSNKEIGLRLGLALITVKMHVSAIFRSLGVVNRTQAVLAARRLGLPEPPPE
jgi:two-component system, NarL family, nitrate/nitrite response regulator NarL